MTKILLAVLSLLTLINARPPTFEEFFVKANETESFLVELRRSIHKDPEIGLHLDRTTEKVRKALEEIGITDISYDWAKGTRTDGKGSGIVFDIMSSKATAKDPIVLLRADMDALPIIEMAEVEFASKNRGVMHACGHDAHTTMLVGAAKLLHSTRDQWPGVVRFMFQPGEELYFGGKYMVEEGVLDYNSRKVSTAFALHVAPAGPSGNLVSYPGYPLAGGREFRITLTGKGGHAGAPAYARDPVVAAAAFILQAQNLASRETFGQGAYRYGLISFTQLRSDADAANIIPNHVEFSGVIRSPSVKTVEHMQTRLREMLKALELSHRVLGTVVFDELVPPLHNDELLAAIHNVTARRASRNPNYRLPFRSSGEYMYALEDFAFIADKVPSVMFGLTTGGGHEVAGHPKTDVTVHSPNFVLDERVLPRGAAFLAHVAVEELVRLKGNDPSKSEL